MILASFYLHVLPKLPTYQVSSQMAFSVQEKFKIDFQDGECGGHSGFSIRTNLAILISKSLRCFLPSFKSLDFLDGDHLGFPIKTTLAIFDLLVVLILPTKFQVNWPLGSGEEAKNRFSRWRPSSIFDRNGFSSF